MLLKLLIVLLLFCMIGNLLLGLKAMLSQRDPLLMSRYIGRRLLFAVFIVLLLIAALATGLLVPNTTPG
ncbi:DUF2909 family protein [Oceanisphaera arctica]|uniref:DUF2909 domain-containing protein n=1 Tax=Oceanisphaera arctica TaxID=641510 RepID=A0A2P5TKK2_9GAMM|nr:DUF2909 family protein [Oceanisphaera arctica]PPL15693.1 hypothetical protein UN63_11785 [Oceanisphaera arctica]GHA13410.1 hypothetical protein GCM10007082_12810 [Oceanisphaera arctica]